MNILLEDIPKYLHQSELYKIFSSNSAENDIICCLYCKQDEQITNNKDFFEMVNTLNFWNCKILPINLINYCLINNDILNESSICNFQTVILLKNFINQSTIINKIKWLIFHDFLETLEKLTCSEIESYDSNLSPFRYHILRYNTLFVEYCYEIKTNNDYSNFINFFYKYGLPGLR